MKAKGKGFLKVTGILLIIFGVIGAISAIYSVMTVVTNSELLEQTYAMINQPFNPGQIKMQGIIMAVLGAVDVAVGIFGILYCNKVDQAGKCFIAAILLIVLELAFAGYLAAIHSFNILTIVMRLILPILYLIGANLNKGSVETAGQ